MNNATVIEMIDATLEKLLNTHSTEAHRVVTDIDLVTLRTVLTYVRGNQIRSITANEIDSLRMNLLNITQKVIRFQTQAAFAVEGICQCLDKLVQIQYIDVVERTKRWHMANAMSAISEAYTRTAWIEEG